MILIVWVLLITALWTLLWSFTLVFVPLTVVFVLIGSLFYLGITSPDISYAVDILSQFMSTPTSVHYSHLLCVFQYLRGTIDRHLFFSSSRQRFKILS
jgi:hypothetical protein